MDKAKSGITLLEAKRKTLLAALESSTNKKFDEIQEILKDFRKEGSGVFNLDVYLGIGSELNIFEEMADEVKSYVNNCIIEQLKKGEYNAR